MTDVLLEARNIGKKFGGVQALKDVSLTIRRGEIYGLIGPNGAGKTTLFNVFTGLYPRDGGEVLFTGQPLALESPHTVAAAGIARTFQNIRLFGNMSARENVMVGAHLALDRNLVKGMLRWPALRRRDAALREEAAALMRYVGLDGYVAAAAGAMPYGALKRLEIARALAANPRLLFLDEPAAGLNPKETAEIDELIRRIADQGITVVLVEHDMKMVMNISDRILVLDYGKKLAEGSAPEVRANPDVIAAYLGAQHA